ncbi:MAG: hypothetical protein JWP36_682 [Paucimonas sp.]|nr:hypothetical protein [Paucimonas sp.]
MTNCKTLDELDTTLANWQAGNIEVAALCQQWRRQRALLAALPPRYEAVMEDVLGRIEASSLFTDESCSFSAADLRAALHAWIAKARSLLSPASSA